MAGGKGGGSAPAAPDPVATAQAQTATNTETARLQAQMNRVNQYGPSGSITYNQDAPDIWSAHTNLSPEQQKLYDLTTQGQTLYGQTAVKQLGSAADTLSTPMTGQPYLDNASDAANKAKWAFDFAADPKQNGAFVDPGTAQRNAALATGSNSLAAANEQTKNAFVDPTTGQSQAATNMASGAASKAYALAGQPINTDYNAVRQQAIDAQNSRLNPQFAQDEETMRSRLLASGIGEGSQAWSNAYRDFNQGKNDAYQQSNLHANDLANQAIQQTGQLRGIPMNELGQAQQMAGNLSSIAGQQQQQAIQGRQVNLGEAERLNAMAGNTASLAGTAQQQALADWQTPYQRAQMLGGIAGNIGNMSGQGIQQQQAVRNQPLNETAALMTGNMIQTPQLMNTPQTQVAPTDVIGSTMGSYNGQLQAYNANQQQKAASLGGLYGLGGSAIMGAGLAFSDRRLKTDIHRIGTTTGGNALYRYRYKGDTAPHIGVMAQELKKTQPDAVVKLGGFYAVDYDKVA